MSPQHGWSPASTRSAQCLLALARPARRGRCGRDRRPRRRSARASGRQPRRRTRDLHGAGSPHHVLYWGAIDWTPRFSRDYSGGWKSKVADYRRFGNSCKAYTGPPLSLMVAACDAPDGSHWALQEWQTVAELRRRQCAGRALHLALARRRRHTRDPDRLQLPRQVPAPLGALSLPRQRGLRHAPHAARRADRQAGPQHLRRLPDR